MQISNINAVLHTNINHTQATLAATVDRLAFIKAQIADLQAEEERCKKTLIESGLSSADGTQHRASVVECSKEVVQWAAVAQHFNPSRQLIRAHTTQVGPYFQIRVFARKTS